MKKMNKMKREDIQSKLLFNQLAKLIRKELALYENLIVVLKEKQDSIIKGKIDDLRMHVQEEQVIVHDAMIMADTRNTQVSRMNNILKISDRSPRLQSIIDKAPLNLFMELSNLRHHLKTSLDQITRINRENSYLLNSSLEYVRGMVQLFLRTDDEMAEIYGVNGMVALKDEGNKVLNCQI